MGDGDLRPSLLAIQPRHNHVRILLHRHSDSFPQRHHMNFRRRTKTGKKKDHEYLHISQCGRLSVSCRRSRADDRILSSATCFGRPQKTMARPTYS